MTAIPSQRFTISIRMARASIQGIEALAYMNPSSETVDHFVPRTVMAGTGRKAIESPQPPWAKAIRHLRLRLKLSQSALGGRIGFSAMTVSRWKRGTYEPPSHGYIGLGNLSRDAKPNRLISSSAPLPHM